jgi:hypothetical protein
MKFWKLLPAVLLAGAVALAADPPPAPSLILVDANGKEPKLKSWKFVAGTRRLAWLAPAAPPKDKDEKPDKPQPVERGPEAVEFRDENSTNLIEGVLTLLLPEHLKSLDFDDEKHTATAKISLGEKPDGDLTLTGSTEYKGSNQVTIEAEIDKGDAGIAEVKYQGGTGKGIRAIRFPNAKAAAESKGRAAYVGIEYKTTKHSEQLADLQPLYRFADGSERLVPTLFFKKTLKLDVGKITRLRAEGRDADGTECRVTTKDGEEQTYTLLKSAMIDGKAATLLGLVGKMRGGYKFYPATTLHSMHFDVQFDEKKEEKPEKP